MLLPGQIAMPGCDPKRIGIYAMSFGVSTALLTNLTNLTNIRSLCLVGGIGFRPKRFIRRFIDRGDKINRKGETRLTRSSGKTMIVQKDFWPSLESLHQEDIVSNLTIPTFVIHGENDTYVLTSDVNKVYHRIGSNLKKLKIYPRCRTRF